MFTQGELRSALVQLANQIMQGGAGGLEANDRFRSMICEPSNLEESLEALALSEAYLFVYASNMLRLIESGEFCSITETRSEENILTLTDTPSQKSRTHGRILAAAVTQLLARERPSYIQKSLVDLVAVCLKVLLEDSNNESYLQSTISAFLQGYRLDDRLVTSSCELLVTPIEPRREVQMGNLQGYCLLVRVFVSMFEYVTVQGGSKAYYEYRKCTYVFRNSYLPYFLQFGVEHIKALLPFASQQLRPVIALTLQLLQAVFMYPFTLSLHEFEVDDDISENITGVSAGDIYLPNFFRHVVCDQSLLSSLMKYWHDLLGIGSFDEVRNEINSLIKVLGRSTCSSQYTFKNEEERIFARNYAQSMIEDFLSSFRYYDSYYLHALLDIVQKHLTMHDPILLQIKRNIVFKVTNFLKLIICHSEIDPFDGKRNPFARAFEIAASITDYAKEKMGEEEYALFKEECQNMLELAFQRITGAESDAIMKKYGRNQLGEIEVFSDLYDGLLPIFEAGLERNLSLFEQLNPQVLSEGAQIMWLHLCAQLLPKTQATLRQTSIIIKYYELARMGDSLAALRYIRTLAEEVLQECNEGVSTTTLWRNIEQLSNASFQVFMTNIIEICVKNFTNRCGEVVDYSLDFFKSIYTLLRKHDAKAFQAYYSIVQHLLPDIQSRIFVSKEQFPKRRNFFNVVSVIWINGESISYLYEIHNLIKRGLNLANVGAFYQYLHDITGLIEPIDRHETFEVTVDLALADLKELFLLHFKDEQTIGAYLDDPFFCKIICKLILALITDVNHKLYFETHTDVPLRIHQILLPVVKQLVLPGKAEGDKKREVSKHLPVILERMVALHPLAQLVSFKQVVEDLRQLQGFDKMVRAYFQNIQRVADIGWMYDLIEQNIEFMMMWWEEAIFRNMHPNVNLRTIAEARIWTTIRQRENLARLIFEIGYYDNSYWNVGEFRSERDFITYFNNLYP